jgi:hypothetical protein
MKLADAGRPTVEDREFERHDRQLGYADKIQHSDEEEVAGDFLPDFLAKDRALEIG